MSPLAPRASLAHRHPSTPRPLTTSCCSLFPQYSRYDPLTEAFSSPVTTIHAPAFSQAAVVKGAALRGLENIKAKFRRLRRHYGIKVDAPFRPGVDPPEKEYMHQWWKQSYCRDVMSWGSRKVRISPKLADIILDCELNPPPPLLLLASARLLELLSELR
jgi:hypothetical protein